MTDTDALRAQYDAAIRPTMLLGLQDADLSGPGGAERIGEWADWISAAVLAVRDRKMEQLRSDLAEADGEANSLALHNDATCEAVAARDRAEATITRVQNALDSGDDMLGLDDIRTALNAEAEPAMRPDRL